MKKRSAPKPASRRNSKPTEPSVMRSGMKVEPLVRPLPQRTKVGKFEEVLSLIAAARQRAFQAVNTELVSLYWELGRYISHKIASAEWGDGVVDELAETIAREYPEQRGFTRANLFRMRQFFETYRDDKKVAPLVRQLPWTHHLILLGRTKHPEELEFYLLAATEGRWPKRELERQIRTGAALRSLPTTKKCHRRWHKYTRQHWTTIRSILGLQ